jgi:HD superfamily phosphohydrolase
LHHIRQNGATFLTYPSIRVHRYEHSLGAMHIAGQLYWHAAEFSLDPDISATISEVVAKIVGKSLQNAMREIRKSVDPQPAFLVHDGLYKLNGLMPFDSTTDEDAGDQTIFAKLLLFQGLRLATLVHDIGHPPFSHTFETALRQSRPDEYEDHEQVGLELLEIIIHDLEETTSKDLYFFAKQVLPIARAIINKKDPHNPLVAGLTKIVSSDIDADRLDYVRRDTTSAGLTTNAYDIGRLVDAVKLKTSLLGTTKTIELVFTSDALSTIEAFFAVRFHLYRWMLWHHNVIRQNMVLILIVNLMTTSIGSLDEKSKSACSEVIRLALDKSARRSYWYFTDYYLLEKMASILEAMEVQRAKENIKGTTSFKKGLSPDDPGNLLYRYLRAFLYREKGYFRSLWKRPDQYQQFAELALDGDGGASALNAKLTSSFLALTRSEMKKAGQDVDDEIAVRRFSKDKIDFLSGRLCRSIEERVQTKGVRVRAYYLAKFKPTPDSVKLRSISVAGTEEEYDVDLLSPSVGALQSAWNSLPHLWLFEEYQSSKRPDDAQKLDALYALIAPVLNELLDEYLKESKT